MKNHKFINGVEKLINPIDTGTLHFIQYFNNKLPVSLQKKIVNSSAKKVPYMGFVVEPYCFFLCYEIKDLGTFEKQLPDNFELTKTKIFEGDEEKHYFLLCCFNARTSAFFGSRVEGYAIATNKETGLLSWVIIDYDTNTISYDSKNGLSGSSVKDGTITTDFHGNIIVDMQRDEDKQTIKFDCNIGDGQIKNLDARLWIEGNLSVAYGNKYSDRGDVFSLKFDPQEMKHAQEINTQNINIEKNTWFNEALEENPSKLVCFPYAQHFISDAPGNSTMVKNEEELIEIINNIDFDKIPPYSNDSFKKIMLYVPMILLTIIFLLTILLIIK